MGPFVPGRERKPVGEKECSFRELLQESEVTIDVICSEVENIWKEYICFKPMQMENGREAG